MGGHMCLVESNWKHSPNARLRIIESQGSKQFALTTTHNYVYILFQVHFKGGEGRGKRFLKNIKSKFGGDSKFSVRPEYYQYFTFHKYYTQEFCINITYVFILGSVQIRQLQ
jgi:hypothetical protein